MLEDRLQKERLYDVYRSLLSDKQVEILDQYFYFDYSALEIADNLGISRQAVHDTIRKSVQMMEVWEEKLHCRSLRSVFEELLEKLGDHAEKKGDFELAETVGKYRSAEI